MSGIRRDFLCLAHLSLPHFPFFDAPPRIATDNPLSIAIDRAGNELDAVGIFFRSDKKTAEQALGPDAVYLFYSSHRRLPAPSMLLHAFGAASSALGFRMFLDRRYAFFAILQET